MRWEAAEPPGPSPSPACMLSCSRKEQAPSSGAWWGARLQGQRPAQHLGFQSSGRIVHGYSGLARGNWQSSVHTATGPNQFATLSYPSYLYLLQRRNTPTPRFTKHLIYAMQRHITLLCFIWLEKMYIHCNRKKNTMISYRWEVKALIY